MAPRSWPNWLSRASKPAENLPAEDLKWLLATVFERAGEEPSLIFTTEAQHEGDRILDEMLSTGSVDLRNYKAHQIEEAVQGLLGDSAELTAAHALPMSTSATSAKAARDALQISPTIRESELSESVTSIKVSSPAPDSGSRLPKSGTCLEVDTDALQISPTAVDIEPKPEPEVELPKSDVGLGEGREQIPKGDLGRAEASELQPVSHPTSIEEPGESLVVSPPSHVPQEKQAETIGSILRAVMRDQAVQAEVIRSLGRSPVYQEYTRTCAARGNPIALLNEPAITPSSVVQAGAASDDSDTVSEAVRHFGATLVALGEAALKGIAGATQALGRILLQLGNSLLRFLSDVGNGTSWAPNENGQGNVFSDVRVQLLTATAIAILTLVVLGQTPSILDAAQAIGALSLCV